MPDTSEQRPEAGSVEEALRESERRYQDFIRQSTEGVWRIELGRNISVNLPPDEQIDLFYRNAVLAECNDAMARMYGLTSADELVGTRLADMLVRDLPANIEYLRAFINSGYRLTDAESTEKSVDGSIRVFLNNFVGVVDDGYLVRGWGTQRDITDRKRAEEALRESEKRLRLLIEQTPAIIWTTDGELRFLSSEGAGLAALGLVPNQVKGMTLFEFFQTREEGIEEISSHRKALLGLSTNYETNFQGRTFHAHVEPLQDAGGRNVGAIGIAIDITDRKLAESVLRDAYDQLEARVRERTAELERANRDLENEIAQRREIEAALRSSEEHYRDAAQSNRLLLQEVDHRVRNNLAGLVSLVSLMRSRSGDVDSFATSIEARLRAMAHVHELLADVGWRTFELEPLARKLFNAMRTLAPHPGEVILSGPPVGISSRQMLPLSMILLEWFTNCGKHGAFSMPGGKINMVWELCKGGLSEVIRLHWRESGGPPVHQPMETSLGTDLVCSFTTIELRGKVQLSYAESGVDHVLEFPRD